MAQKKAEALAHVNNAEKLLKTSFLQLRFKPEFDEAATEYKTAANLYRAAQSYEEAADCHVKASECYKTKGAEFHAAKQLEAAAMILKDHDQMPKAVNMIKAAVDLYVEHGTPDTAALSLDRAAKMVTHANPALSVELYTKACDVREANGNPKECAESIGRAARVLLRMKRYDQALGALRKEIDFLNEAGESHGLVNKLVMGVVLVHLHMGDLVAAQQELAKAHGYYSFADSEEAGGIAALIEAYDQGDGPGVARAARSELFRFMENEFTKLARDLQLPGQPDATETAADGDNDGGYGELL